MTNEDLIAIGFRPMPNFTILNSVIFDLGRNRYLSAGCVGTCNEIVFISEQDDKGEVSDCICIHNYDYDGFLTLEKIKCIIMSLTIKNK